MSKGVCYILLGRKHLYQLTISLWSLRRHYDGPVAVLTDAADPFIDKLPGVELVRVSPDPSVRNPAFLLKPQVARLGPFESALFLDADTLVVGDVGPLFPRPDDDRVWVTRHSDWTTAHPQMKYRFRLLSEQGHVHPKKIEALIDAGEPAINTGVFSLTRACRVVDPWVRWTRAFDAFHLHDEAALQLLLPSYPNHVLPDCYNCHPAFSRRPAAEVVIWHFCSGRVGLPGAKGVWFEAVRGAWRDDFAGLRSWLPEDPTLVFEDDPADD